MLSPPSSALINARLVVNLSLAVNYALGGYNVWGWHALNLTIHILAGLTLLGIVRRTLRQPPLRERFGAVADGLALAVALIWTVHPLQTESVTYIIQRAESIMGLFYLLTLYGFIRGAASPRPRLWYGLCLGACALGMASKEVMVSAPLMVLLYDRAFISGSFREAWRRRWPLYLGLSANWILLGFMVVSAGTFKASAVAQYAGGGRRWGYLLTEPGVILYYLRLAAWPYPLCFDYYGWPLAGTGLSLLLPTLVIAILLGATAWTCKTNSAWGILGAWFFLILAPSSSIIPLDSPAYEHRMYLPLAAVLTVVVLVAFVLRKKFLRNPSGFVLGWIACGLVVVPLTVLTIRRNRDYVSDVAIWDDTVAKCPQNPRAHCNLGFALSQIGKTQEAISQYEQALQIKPDYPEVHIDLGIALAQTGSIEEAIAHYELALRIIPITPMRTTIWGRLWCKRVKSRTPSPTTSGPCKSNPITPMRTTNSGSLWRKRVRSRKPSPTTSRPCGSIPISPSRTTIWETPWRRWAGCRRRLHSTSRRYGSSPISPMRTTASEPFWRKPVRSEDAIAHFEQALRIKPDFADAQNRLGTVLAQAGKFQEAITHFQQALRLNPDYAEVHANLGNTLAQVGRVPEAIVQYQEALKLRPDLTAARNALARLQPRQ